MIKIVYYTETIDNWGRTESSVNPKRVHAALKNADGFSDDIYFEDENCQVYFIDDLIGKEVIVEGFESFIVTE